MVRTPSKGDDKGIIGDLCEQVITGLVYGVLTTAHEALGSSSCWRF